MDDLDAILSPILDRLEAACQTIGKLEAQLDVYARAVEESGELSDANKKFFEKVKITCLPEDPPGHGQTGG